jgi:glucose-1-phosphate cytidylyltransferase
LPDSDTGVDRGVDGGVDEGTRRPPVVILCGGRGTRLQEQGAAAGPAGTQRAAPGRAVRPGGCEIPKPLVEIGGEPIVGHVIGVYAAQGFERFVLATGYRGAMIEDYARVRSWPAGVTVECVDTGVETPTGARIKLLESWLAGEGTFCVTYADGVADIDLDALLAFHTGHGALASMTVVRPELQFGVAELDGEDRVSGFREKPRSEQWVNGGFFCFEPHALDRMTSESVLEREPLRELAAAGELRAYRHNGFWKCMDTYKDTVVLNDLWAAGRAPWRAWE